jgi:hypothetical protein
MLITTESTHALSAFFVALSYSLIPISVDADSLRGTFPGNRVGGGTRGECSARLIIHLVPESGKYDPSSAGSNLIGLLQGPSLNPMPLVITFRPFQASGPSDKASQSLSTFRVKPSNASLILLDPGFDEKSMIWESAYECDENGDSGEFGFITSSSPPALSLLTKTNDLYTGNSKTAGLFKSWKNLCGASIPTNIVLNQFGFGDLLTQQWPTQLPVLCP